MEKVNLHEKFGLFTEYWSPKIAGELNGQQIKLVKFLGSFVWHHHENEEELFFVVKGRFPHGVSGSARLARGRRVLDRSSGH